MISTKEISKTLEEVAMLLELKGVNTFKVNAFLNAAHEIEKSTLPIKELSRQIQAGQVKGIGKSLTSLILELIKTGDIPLLNELKQAIPPGLVKLLSIQGLSAKKIYKLYQELQITNISDLQKACLENRVSSIKGFGVKSQQNILKSISYLNTNQGKILYPEALEIAKKLIASITNSRLCNKIEVVGELRRSNEIVQKVSLIACSAQSEKLMHFVCDYPEVQAILQKGKNESIVRFHAGIEVNLRIISEEKFAFAELFFTGSQKHFSKLQACAQRLKLNLSENGLYENNILLNFSEEKEIFDKLKLAYILPELREDFGEIEYAQRLFEEGKEFPNLVTDCDIKGILHVHTTYSDGKNTLREMVFAAKSLGYEYIGITDHSQSAVYARGLRPDRVKLQHQEIDSLNEELRPFKIFKGIESDILADGSLDYPEEILQSFDFVIASVHSQFKMSYEEMTCRVIRAVQNPFTTILGHPTGRRLLKREGYVLDLEQVLSCAAEAGVCIEFNSNPQRFDLNWSYLKQASTMGVLIPICPDAHSIEDLSNLGFGINVARKGWLTPSNTLNHLDVDQISKFFFNRKSKKTYSFD